MIEPNNLYQLFKLSPCPSLILKPDPPFFTIAAVNDAYLIATTTTEDYLIDNGLFKAFPDNPDDKNANGVFNLHQSLLTVIDTKSAHKMSTQKYDIPIRGTDKFEEKYWKPENIPVLDNNNDIVFILHTVQDVTVEIKQLQQLIPNAVIQPGKSVKDTDFSEAIVIKQQIEDSEKKYRYLFENNPCPMFIWDFETLEIIDCNDELLQKYGYSKQEFLQLTLKDIRPKEDIQFLSAIIEGLEGDVYERSVRHQKKSGEVIYVKINGHIIQYNQRKVSLVQISDVTEKENALNLLKENEVKLLTAQKIAKLGYWYFDTGKQDLFWSDEVYTIWNVPKGNFELSYETFFNSIHPDDKAQFAKAYTDAVETLTKLDIQHRILLPDGSIKWVHEKGKQVGASSENNGVFFEGTVQDISAQKLLSISLEESNQRYHYVTKATSDAIWDWNLLTDEIYWGAGVKRIFGHTEAEMKADKSFWKKHVHPADKERVNQKLNAVINGLDENWEDEYRYLKQDGTYAYVADKGFLIRNSNGLAIRMAGAMQDITRKKKEEERLKLLEQVVTNTNDAVVIAEIQNPENPTPAIVYVNDAFTKITGYTAEEVMGLSTSLLHGPNSSKVEIERLDEAFKNQMPCEITTIAYKKNGEEFWVNSSVSPITTMVGSFTHWIAVQRDVTEKIKAQEEIVQQKKFTEDILNNIPSDIAVFNSEHQYLFLNSNAIADKETREWLIGKNDFDYCARKGTGNAVAEQRSQLFNKSVAGKMVVDWIDEHQTKEGELRYIFRKFYPYFENEKLKYVFGYGTDITERKKAEIELLKVYAEKENILESIGDAFFAVDKNWIVTYWNYQAEKILVKRKNETLGNNLWEVFGGSVNTLSYKKYHEAIATGKVVRFEDYYQRLGKYYEISAYPSANGLSVYFKDITLRSQLEQRMKSERNLLRTLIDNLPDTIYFKDKAARKLISNRFDYKLLGASCEEEVLGKTDLELLPYQIGSVCYNHDLEILKTGKPLINLEESFTPERSEPLWLLTTKLPLRNDQGEIIGLLGIGRDITETKKAAEKLNELNKQLEKHVKQLELSNIELEQFAYVASHDLQEPLRMVSSFLTKLEKKYGNVLDENAKKYIHFAVDGSSRMRQIILDLLEFSKIGREEDKLEEVDLNEVLNEILILHRRQIQEKNAVVVADVLPVLKTFRAPMRQVFQNLVSNSLKYAKDPLVHPAQINIKTIEINNHWQFTIQDNGIGIDPQYFEKIFIIFQRLHNREAYSGTGVGLAITKKIIENMGGKIWLESEEGNGSIFHFTLLKQ